MYGRPCCELLTGQPKREDMLEGPVGGTGEMICRALKGPGERRYLLRFSEGITWEMKDRQLSQQLVTTPPLWRPRSYRRSSL